MITDQNKKTTGITYNILNLPSVIPVSGKCVIRYYYDAAGNKLQKRTIDITTGPSKTTVTTYIEVLFIRMTLCSSLAHRKAEQGLMKVIPSLYMTIF